MARIDDIIRARDVRREAKAAVAAVAARAALRALKQVGICAHLVGSLARGDFRQHSDIDILIDAPPERRSAALRTCLKALRGFPSSILFKDDLTPDALSHFMREVVDEPRLRG